MMSHHNRRRRPSTQASRKKGKSRPINAHAYRLHARLDANQALARARARARVRAYAASARPLDSSRVDE